MVNQPEAGGVTVSLLPVVTENVVEDSFAQQRALPPDTAITMNLIEVMFAPEAEYTRAVESKMICLADP